MEVHGERQSFARGRHGQSTEGIDLPLLVAHRTDRGLSPRGPGTLKTGNKQKAAFIQGNQIDPPLGGLFLYGATRSASNARSWPRLVAERAAGVSDNSTPSLAAAARSHVDDSAREIAARSPWRYALRSITRSDTLRPALLEARWWPVVPSPGCISRRADQDSGASVTPLALAVCRYGSIARRNFLLLRV